MVTALSRSLKIGEEIGPKECVLRSNSKPNNVNLLHTILLNTIGSLVSKSFSDQVKLDVALPN